MIKLPLQVNTAFALLEAAGFEAYLVGGAVRDYVRNQSPAKDWDITTNALPEQVEAVFSAYHIFETGLKHGTVTAMIDHEPIEITTYRIGGDGHDFASSLREDLEHRDFTMNALAYNPRSGIVDIMGGCDDIAAGLVRCVGDPGSRFQEDGLRILRALRFASVFEMQMESNTAAAIHRNKQLLLDVAPERIQVELTKMLCGVGVGDVLTDYADVLAVCVPEITPMFGFVQHNPHHNKDVWLHTVAVVSAIPPEPILRWAALLHDVGKPHCFTIGEDGIGHFYGHAERSTELAESIFVRLRFDNARRERVLRLVRYHDLPISADKKPVKRLMNKHGVEAVLQLIELHKADTFGQSALCMERITEYEAVRAMVSEIITEESCFSLKDLAINGNDLLALGYKGKSVGKMLQVCLNAVIDEQVPNESETLLEFVSEQHRVVG